MMSKHARIFTLLAAGFIAQGDKASAITVEGIDMYHEIATCVGRFSAQMEFAHLMGADSTQPQQSRERFVELYQALDGGEDFLDIRINAKRQQARLLNMMEFSENAREARIARRVAESQIETCSRMLL